MRKHDAYATFGLSPSLYKIVKTSPPDRPLFRNTKVKVGMHQLKSPSTPGVKQVLQNYRTCLILEARLCYQSDATHFQLFDENLENKVLSIFHLLTPPSKSLPSPDVGQFLKYCFWRFQSSLF